MKVILGLQPDFFCVFFVVWIVVIVSVTRQSPMYDNIFVTVGLTGGKTIFIFAPALFCRAIQECPTGSNSSECRICSDYHMRQDATCRSCPGFGSASGAWVNGKDVGYRPTDKRLKTLGSSNLGGSVSSKRSIVSLWCRRIQKDSSYSDGKSWCW